MQRLRKAICFILTFAMCMTTVLTDVGYYYVLTVNAAPLWSRKSDFSTEYTVEKGNKAQTIVNIAVAQEGKSFFYDVDNDGEGDPWCAAFVSDCAILAGADDVIPSSASCTDMYNTMTKNYGARELKEDEQPVLGDLVFYYCSYYKDYEHIGIIIDPSTTIEGNLTYTSDPTSMVRKTTYTLDPDYGYSDEHGHKCTPVYVRPNYGGSSQSAQTPKQLSFPAVKSAQITEKTPFGYKIFCTTEPGVSKVEFPTWTEKKQVKWYVGQKISNTEFVCNVFTRDFCYDTGEYVTDIYTFDSDGKMNTEAWTERVTISPETGGNGSITVNGEVYFKTVINCGYSTDNTVFSSPEDNIINVKGNYSEDPRFIDTYGKDGAIDIRIWNDDISNYRVVTTSYSTYSNGCFDINVDISGLETGAYQLQIHPNGECAIEYRGIYKDGNDIYFGQPYGGISEKSLETYRKLKLELDSLDADDVLHNYLASDEAKNNAVYDGGEIYELTHNIVDGVSGYYSKARKIYDYLGIHHTEYDNLTLTFKLMLASAEIPFVEGHGCTYDWIWFYADYSWHPVSAYILCAGNHIGCFDTDFTEMVWCISNPTDSFDGTTLKYKQTLRDINVETPSQEEIRNHMGHLSYSTEYDENPLADAPYSIGKLSYRTQQNALNTMNLMRYIAGIPDNVELGSDEMIKKSQAAALINCVNGTLSHYPNQPEGMDDAMYQTCLAGSSSSNLGYGYYSFYDEIYNGWMNDGDLSNISRVGHRRWILNPSMGKTAFGCVQDDGRNFYAMYAFDESGTDRAYNGVSWPAHNMPVEYFGTTFPWSISFNAELSTDLKVTLTRKNDGKTWNFDRNSKDFYVNNGTYGQIGCVIFRPSIDSYKAGDSFDVRIKGTGIDVSYSVDFFRLKQISSIELSKEAIEIKTRESITVSSTISPVDATEGIVWTSSNPEIATVNSDGRIIALNEGETIITVSGEDGVVSAECRVIVVKNINNGNTSGENGGLSGGGGSTSGGGSSTGDGSSSSGGGSTAGGYGNGSDTGSHDSTEKSKNNEPSADTGNNTDSKEKSLVSVSKIIFTKTPTKTFNYGSKFKFDGKVTAFMSDGTKAEIANSLLTISSPNMKKSGKQVVTVSYNTSEKTHILTYKITVKEKVVEKEDENSANEEDENDVESKQETDVSEDSQSIKSTIIAPKTKINSIKSKKVGKITVKLGYAPTADGYQIICSKRKSFYGAKKKNIKSSYLTSVTISKLSKGSTYYVKVRTYVLNDKGEKVFGSWSKVKSVKVKA